MYYCTFKFYKSNVLQLKCVSLLQIHSNQALYKSNVPLYSKCTQNSHSSTHMCHCILKPLEPKPSSTQMHFCAPNTHKLASLTSNVYSLPIHSHHTLFNSNVPCTLNRLKWPSYFKMCLIALNELKERSYPTQITSIFSNMYNLHSTPLKHVLLSSNDLNTLRCAWLHSTPSNHVTFNSNDLNMLKCALLHSTTSNQILLNWNEMWYTQKIHKCTQPTQITIEMYQTCMQVIQTLKSTHTTSLYALVHLKCSNLQTSKPSNTNQCPKCASMHLQHEAPKSSSAH